MQVVRVRARWCSRHVKVALVLVLGVALVGAGVIGGGITITAPVYAENSNSGSNEWGNLMRLNEEEPVSKTNHSLNCPVATTSISVRGADSGVEACVFGSRPNARVARYADNSGNAVYAIAYVMDDSYTPITGICTNQLACAYSAKTDTFLLRVGSPYGNRLEFIDNFTRYLSYIDSAQPYYEFNQEAPHWQFENNGLPVGIQQFALSQSGDWVFVELYERGFGRLNLETKEFKRVAATNGNGVYGYGRDPTFELAIANDGTHAIVTGQNGGLAVYEITDTCGDDVTTMTSSYFATGATPCRIVGFNTDVFTLNFYYALAPTFLNDAKTISFYVEASGYYRHYLVTPKQNYDATPLAYVALGDSFTSGEGELGDEFYEAGTNVTTINTSGNRCHVSVRSYPYIVGGAFSLPTSNKACSGSTVENVYAVLHGASMTGKGSPALVTVSVGGNDVGLVDKLKSCLGPGTCDWATQDNRYKTADEIQAYFNTIVDLIDDVKSTTPRASVAIIGYPRVVNAGNDASCSAVNNVLLNETERKYFDESIQYLNKIMRAAAYYTGVRYIDIENSLIGTRLCDVSETSVNGLRYGDDIAPISYLESFKPIGAESFHPTPLGHVRIAGVIESQLNTTWPDISCSDCVYSSSLIEPPEYWDYSGDSSSEDASVPPSEDVIVESVQRRVSFLDKLEATSADTVSINLPEGTFASDSAITIEAHSAPVTLRQTWAGEDGSVSTNVVFSSLPTGYHTVHIYGTSPSRVTLDIYQVVAVVEDSTDIVDIVTDDTGVDDSGNSNNQHSGSETTSQVTSATTTATTTATTAATAPTQPTSLMQTPQLMSHLATGKTLRLLQLSPQSTLSTDDINTTHGSSQIDENRVLANDDAAVLGATMDVANSQDDNKASIGAGAANAAVGVSNTILGKSFLVGAFIVVIVAVLATILWWRRRTLPNSGEE